MHALLCRGTKFRDKVEQHCCCFGFLSRSQTPAHTVRRRRDDTDHLFVGPTRIAARARVCVCLSPFNSLRRVGVWDGPREGARSPERNNQSPSEKEKKKRWAREASTETRQQRRENDTKGHVYDRGGKCAARAEANTDKAPQHRGRRGDMTERGHRNKRRAQRRTRRRTRKGHALGERAASEVGCG